MNNYLKIKADVEDDGTVGLIARVSCDGFSGFGEAWFNLTEVKNFISQLLVFSKSTQNPPLIAGGNWDGNGNLSEVLLSFRFYSFSDFRVGVHVTLANHPYTDCRKEEISRVTVELKPEMQTVLSFCEQLNDLLLNDIQEACLVC